MDANSTGKIAALAVGWAIMGWCGVSVAQVQNHVTLPSTTISDSFYEGIGIGWGIDRRRPNGSGWFFNNGGPGPVPRFGGFDPNAGASLGFGGPGWGFNINAGQGSSRSIVGQSASVTVPNGGGGFISSTSIRPFVTGLIPVVGDARLTTPLDLKLEQLRQGERPAPATDSAAAQEQPLRLDGAQQPAAPVNRSSAERATGSISEMRRLWAGEEAAQREEARQLIVRARRAEDQGKDAFAVNYYRHALKMLRKDDPWVARILERVRGLAEK